MEFVVFIISNLSVSVVLNLLNQNFKSLKDGIHHISSDGIYLNEGLVFRAGITCELNLNLTWWYDGSDDKDKNDTVLILIFVFKFLSV